MKRYDATFSSAMFVGSFVISASIMSAVHYDTFQNLESLWNWIMYLLGLMILMAGVKMLVSATTQQPLMQQEETATATATAVAATGDSTDSTSTGGTNHPAGGHDQTNCGDCNRSSRSCSISSSCHNELSWAQQHHQSYSMSCPLIVASHQEDEHGLPPSCCCDNDGGGVGGRPEGRGRGRKQDKSSHAIVGETTREIV
jgi:hypothetical protein